MSKQIDFAARAAGGEYENDEPITDQFEILDLLVKRDGDSREGRYIYTGEKLPELRCGWFIDGDSGGARSGTDYYQVKPEVVDELKKKGFVTPKREPMIGRTIVHDNRLVISDQGHLALIEYLDKQLVRARRLRERRRPGQRRPTYRLIGRGRKDISFGPLFYEFKNTRTLKTSHVFPELRKIERVAH